jgi:hypothetical protein
MTPSSRSKDGVLDRGGQLVTLVVGATERRATKVLAQWSAYWTDAGPEHVALGCGGEPALTLTVGTEDAALMADGKLAPSVAYMQGRLKTAGDNSLLLRVLRWTATPAFQQALARWKQTPALRPESLLASVAGTRGELATSAAASEGKAN